jgi:glucokinase
MELRGGIDLGGTKIQAVVVDAEHAVLGEARRATPTSGGPADVALEMVETLRDALASAGADAHALSGVGVGSPGECDARRGTVARAGNLPGWQEPFPLAAAISERIGVPTLLGNDVGVALDAEARLGGETEHRTRQGDHAMATECTRWRLRRERL